jgi:4-hydroxythreonine-4-phosphate dehydrogenase
MVTGPINKESLKMAGYEGGHTEILKDFAGINSIDTIFCIENLKIFFLSRHLPLKDAISLVKKENILKALINIDNQMKMLGYKKPVIGLPGINPHCSDGGIFGREEIEELLPAIKEARQKGINVEGPVGADSIYHLGIKGNFDAILSLYHDQGHIASKTYDFYKTVTMTTGLPYIRTSVDHGTGFDIAWKGHANHESLIKALELAVELVRKQSKPGYTEYSRDA